MNHSDGPKKIQMAYGTMRFGNQTRMTNDLTRLLRKSYPQFFTLAGQNTEQDLLAEDSLFDYDP